MRCGSTSTIGLVFSCVVLLFASPLASQNDAGDLLRLADAYYDCGNYDASITEYLRFICFEPDDPRLSHAYYKAALAHGAMGNGNRMIPYLERAASLAADAAFEREIRLRLALGRLSQRQFDLAKIDLFRLMNDKETGLHKDRAALLLGLVHCTEGAWEKARACFSVVRAEAVGDAGDAEALSAIDSILLDMSANPRRKSPTLAKWISTIIPGSGQVYAGNGPAGLNAIGLNALTSWALLDLLSSGYARDAALFFSLVWVRYYQGNRLRAEEAATEANRAYVEERIRLLCALAQRLSRAMAEDPAIAP